MTRLLSSVAIATCSLSLFWKIDIKIDLAVSIGIYYLVCCVFLLQYIAVTRFYFLETDDKVMTLESGYSFTTCFYKDFGNENL